MVLIPLNFYFLGCCLFVNIFDFVLRKNPFLFFDEILEQFLFCIILYFSWNGKFFMACRCLKLSFSMHLRIFRVEHMK